ncbi:hypothetical protein FBU30_010665 [Linnemannia zychae]|nr:hypothetical protein FBU30_010665 [Linnemannia zychae]
MKFATAILLACAPSLGLALIGNYWTFKTAPAGGLNDVTFSFDMAKAPHKKGYYFAQQFNFNGIKNVGYIGLQPRPDSNGSSVIHAAFSSFQGGTVTSHPNCHTGADGGAGVSCAVDILGDYNHVYAVTVENISGTTWRGTLTDTVTNTEAVIGEWTLPSEAGKIRNWQMGFVEYFPWNSQPSHTCSSLPFTEVTFFNPTSKTPGASEGKVYYVHEYGDCVGQAGYATTQFSNGFDINCGF